VFSKFFVFFRQIKLNKNINHLKHVSLISQYDISGDYIFLFFIFSVHRGKKGEIKGFFPLRVQK
jgi:hypothetical protein